MGIAYGLVLPTDRASSVVYITKKKKVDHNLLGVYQYQWLSSEGKGWLSRGISSLVNRPSVAGATNTFVIQ